MRVAGGGDIGLALVEVEIGAPVGIRIEVRGRLAGRMDARRRFGLDDGGGTEFLDGHGRRFGRAGRDRLAAYPVEQFDQRGG